MGGTQKLHLVSDFSGRGESTCRCSFLGFRELESASVPSSMKVIDSNPFTDCPKLARIEVSENHPNYSTMNGVLFNKEKTFLISCPQAMNGIYEVPDGVSPIRDAAFWK